MERVTNEEVLQRAGVKREIMKTVRQRQMKILGHVLRQQQMETLCLTGKVEGRRGRGKPRTKILDCLAKSVGGGYTSKDSGLIGVASHGGQRSRRYGTSVR